jgi:hypothetical protein
VYVAGSTSPYGYGYYLSLLRKYDFDGGMLWSTEFEPPNNLGGGETRISAGSSGIYLIMQTANGVSFLFNFDSSGRSVWSLQLPPSERFADKIATFDGGIYIGGSTGDAVSSAGTSALVAEYSPASSLIFFGLSPPFSFIALAATVGGAIAGWVFMRTRWKNKRRRVVGVMVNRRKLLAGGL